MNKVDSSFRAYQFRKKIYIKILYKNIKYLIQKIQLYKGEKKKFTRYLHSRRAKDANLN